jgi:hypothetical protein
MKNKRTDLLLFAVTVVFTMSFFSCALYPKPSAEELAKIPLPTDIHIVTPPADLPREIAAFSGKWTGKWDGVLASVLIVEEINDTEAKIILCQGNYSGPEGIGVGEAIEPGCRRILAKVSIDPQPNIEFELKRSDHPVVTFQMHRDLTTIKGFWVYVSDLQEDHFPIIRITMKRTD